MSCGAASRKASKRPSGRASLFILDTRALLIDSWVSMQRRAKKRRKFLKIRDRPLNSFPELAKSDLS
jgi:hypothetical protein